MYFDPSGSSFPYSSIRPEICVLAVSRSRVVSVGSQPYGTTPVSALTIVITSNDSLIGYHLSHDIKISRSQAQQSLVRLLITKKRGAA
jgi:hypothetical protein